MLHRNDDPVLRSAFREMLVVLAIWIAAGSYSIGYCWLYGYNRPASDLRFVWGFPDWVFWGLVVPWVVCALVSLVVSLVVMTDEDLGADASEEEFDDA